MQKRIGKIFMFLMVCSALFTGIDSVKADTPLCENGINIQKAYACDYSEESNAGSADYTLLYVKYDGGYCATVNSMSLKLDDQFLILFDSSEYYDSSFYNRMALDLGDEGKNAVENKTCPRVKAVVDTNLALPFTGGTTVKKITFSRADDPFFIIDGESIKCGFSNTVGYWDSFCLLSDGTNFRQVSKEDAESIISETNSTAVIDAEKIMEWARTTGQTGVENVGDPCSVISGTLSDTLTMAVRIISIAGIILVVVMTAISFVKAIIGSDDEKLKNAFSHLVTRIIVVVILLLLPMILTFIINLVNSAEGTVKIGNDGNPFCDIA